MWMYSATLAYFLCGVYIIPESHWGVGLKPGMHTISQQEAKQKSTIAPRPDVSIARTVGGLNYSTKVRNSYAFRTQIMYETKEHGRLLLIFSVLLKTPDLWYVLQLHCTKFHNITKILKGIFFHKNAPKQSVLRALFLFKIFIIHKLSTLLGDICQALPLKSSMFYIYTGLDTKS